MTDPNRALRSLVPAAVIAVLATAVAAAGTAAAAEVALTGGRSAVLRDGAGSARDRAKADFRGAIGTPPSPLCAAGNAAIVTLATSDADRRRITVPCEKWSATRGGYAYRDSAGATGGVTSIRLEADKLQVELRGASYQAIAGPIDALEVGLSVGDTSWCGRFTTFRRNEPAAVIASGPTSPCSAAEAAGDLLGSRRGGTAMWDYCEGKSDETPVPVDPRSLVQPGISDGRAVHFNTWWKNCHVDPEAVQEVAPAQTCGELRERWYRGDLLLDPGSYHSGGLFTGTDPGNGSSSFTADQLNQIWQVWGGYLSRPENFDELVAERYGSGFSDSPNPYPLPGEDPNLTGGGSGRLPEMFTQLRDAYGDWSGRITVTCHACHSGSVGGDGGPGPGMAWGGGSSLADLNLFLRDFLAAGYQSSAAVVLNLNRTRGRNNASLVNLAFAMAGIHGPEVMAGVVTSGSTADMDTPAWWNMGSRAVKFVDGVFPMDAPRIDAIFYAPSIGITEAGKAWMRENGPDMNVWVESLKSPVYPFPIDLELAEEGAVLFHTLDMWAPERGNPILRPEGNGSCASCHGAYAPRYVNDPAFLATPALEGVAAYIVPLDIIGTDPERVNANNDAVQEAGTTSFFSYPETVGTDQDCGPQNRPELRGDRQQGYQAPPLYGVWASAPYFHNGSVPNLWEVLQPADRHQIWRRVSKPKPAEQSDCLTCSTVMGYDTDLSRAYDTQKVGWKYDPVPCEVASILNPSVTPYVNCNPDEQSQEDPLTEQILAQFYSNVLLGWNIGYVPPLTDIHMEDRKNFNTRMFAQGNEGHEFNSVLTDHERLAIIEYMKTL